MRKIILLSIIIIPLFLGSCHRQSSKDDIKVVTFNIGHDDPADSVNAWANRASMVCYFLQDESPDLFGLQDVEYHQYIYIDSLLTNYGSIGVGSDDGVRTGAMTPLFYRKDRFEMVRSKSFWLSPTPEVAGEGAWGASSRQIVTWVELVENETQEHIFFFNTHFAHDSDTARINSAYLLRSRVDSISDGHPFIITGNLNMRPSSKGYEILTAPFESVPLLSDAYVEIGKQPEGPPNTYNAYSKEVTAERIDYILMRNGMSVVEYETFVVVESGLFISDHWPVMALLSLK